MPSAVISLIVFFAAASAIIGLIAWWVIGPRRPLAAILPIVAAFLGFYVVGHKSGATMGPTMLLFGFEVTLLWDLLVAAVAAVIVAKVQCLVLGRVATRRAGA